MKDYFYETYQKAIKRSLVRYIDEMFGEAFSTQVNCRCHVEPIIVEKVPRAIVNGLFFEKVKLETHSLVPIFDVDQINEEIEKPKDEFSLFGCRILVQECVPENTIWLIVPPSSERGSDKPSIKVIKIVENLEVK